MADESDVAGVPLPPPLIYVAGLAAGGVVELIRSTTGPPWPISVAILVAGVLTFMAVAGGAVRRQRHAGTTENPFKPTTALVFDGPYRFTRNPMYLGMAAVYVGLAFVLGLMWAFVFLPLVLLTVDRLVIAREERYLERKFGEEYVAYKGRVRRWI
jgi:protein-S-isoprenylcysteine O-methyltransferase Ste14